MPDVTGFQSCCGAGILYSLKCLPTKKEFDRHLNYAKKCNYGVLTFIDNNLKQILAALDSVSNKYIQGTKSQSGGEAWCEFIREQGYRCDAIWMGGNPNHNEVEPHVLTMYIWYINKQKDTESVTIGKQPQRGLGSKVEPVAPAQNSPPSRTASILAGALAGFGGLRY